MILQQVDNPDDFLYIFAPHPQAPYRYFNSEVGLFSEPGFIVHSNVVSFSEEQQYELEDNGFTVLLEPHTQAMVMDSILCPVSLCFENLQLIIRRMN